MNPQTPQEAIEMIDRALAQLNASREAHFTLQQAVMTLRRFIMENQKELPVRAQETP